MLKVYQCPKCGAMYLECDLLRTKCSENYVGTYIEENCPKCFRRLEIVKLRSLNEEENISEK